MKQTAVEWLIQELQLFYLNKSKSTYNEIIEQAKEIEKHHIIEAHGNQTKKASPLSTYIRTGERYYNETFKKH